MAWMARRGTLVLIVVIGLLLPALAALQYRWMGEISRLEQVRAKTNIDAAAQRFSTEFDEMLAGVYSIYHSQLPTGRGLAQDPARAADQAVRPQVAKQVLVISRDGRDGFTVRELDAAGRPGQTVPWPAWIDPRPSGTSAGGEDAPLPRGLQRTLLDEVPALVVRRGSPHDEWIVVVLDLPRIVDDVLPAMLAGCLEGGVPVNYDVLVNREDVPQQVLYQSGPGLVPEAFADWVSLMPVFGIHSRDLDPVTAQGLMPDAAAHRWRLFIKPEDGSLEAAVDAARRRNLWIGAGVLTLLALSVGAAGAVGPPGRAGRPAVARAGRPHLARAAHAAVDHHLRRREPRRQRRRQHRGHPAVRPDHPAGGPAPAQDDRRHPALLPAADPGRRGAQPAADAGSPR